MYVKLVTTSGLDFQIYVYLLRHMDAFHLAADGARLTGVRNMISVIENYYNWNYKNSIIKNFLFHQMLLIWTILWCAQFSAVLFRGSFLFLH